MASEPSVTNQDRLPPINGAGSSIHMAATLHKKDDANARPAEHMSILTPMQTHMQTIEGKRAMLIMDNCITKVLLVAAFPLIVSDMKTYELLLGREVVLLFKEYEMIADAYEIAVKTPVHGSRSSLRVQEAHHALHVLKKRLFDIFRDITRSILQNPNVTSALIRHFNEWKTEPNNPTKKLTSILIQLRFILRQVLLVTAKEAVQRSEYIERAETKGKEQAKAIQRLMERLTAMTVSHNKVSEQKITEIEELESKLISTERAAQQTISIMHDRHEFEHNERRKKHNKTILMLGEDATMAKQLFENETKAISRRKLAIRRQKWRLEDQLDGIIRKMDDQLYDLREKYDDTMEQFEREERAYNALYAKFKPLKEEYDTIIEERARKEKERQAALREREEMVKSATFITSLYRAYKARQRIRAERRKRRKR